MTACLKMSMTEITGDAPRIRQRTSRWVAWPKACAAAALGSILFVGLPGETVAQEPGEVWAGCELDPNTVSALKADMGNTFVEDGQVAFAVVYTMKDNDGQEFRSGQNKGEFTGPVICINPTADVVNGPDPAEFQGVGIAEIQQDDPIPNGQADDVITRDAEEVFILRYELVGGADEGTIEKVLCHAVNDGMFCYRISPLLP